MNQSVTAATLSIASLKVVSKALLMLIAGVLLSACGGGEDDPKRIPLPPGASQNSLASERPYRDGRHWSSEDSEFDRKRSEGLERAKQLREQCFSLNKNESNFWWCAAGTYKGVDAGTGADCSTTLTADGYVSFVNGSRVVDPFKLSGGSRLSGGPAGGSHWELQLEGESLFGFKRFQLTVDTSKSDQIRIHQHNSALFSTKLDNTCITRF